MEANKQNNQHPYVKALGACPVGRELLAVATQFQFRCLKSQPLAKIDAKDEVQGAIDLSSSMWDEFFENLNRNTLFVQGRGMSGLLSVMQKVQYAMAVIDGQLDQQLGVCKDPFARSAREATLVKIGIEKTKTMFADAYRQERCGVPMPSYGAIRPLDPLVFGLSLQRPTGSGS
jgi:hypothetical protein